MFITGNLAEINKKMPKRGGGGGRVRNWKADNDHFGKNLFVAQKFFHVI